MCRTVQLESLNSEDLATIVEEVRSKVKMSDAPLKLTRESHNNWLGGG